jgi:hypothetical protein
LSVVEPPLAKSDLKHLDGRTFDAVLAWLERALRGQEALPRVVPDEPPEEPILRHERTLATMTRQDLREACRVLVRRFVRQPADSDDFVAALVRLARGLELVEVAPDLHALAGDEARFAGLGAAQQKVVLTALLDLRAQLPPAFWQDLVERDPARFGVVAFSGLLRRGSDCALRMLPLLPDDERIADEVFVVLGQHAQMLNAVEREKLVASVRSTAPDARPYVRAALGEWADEQLPPQPSEVSPAVLSRLDQALIGWHARRQTVYERAPRSARIAA